MWNFALKLLFLIFIINTTTTSTSTLVSATDYIVGANKGWNPGINYTIWANNHTFYVGDLISFRYTKNQYNVFEVNQIGYDKCTLSKMTNKCPIQFLSQTA
ncbi:hypothetical protein MKW92_047580 [Papaver armeniacum]|nr:hypothetical protein MKW92_047580 [Papaver armeniacum]